MRALSISVTYHVAREKIKWAPRLPLAHDVVDQGMFCTAGDSRKPDIFRFYGVDHLHEHHPGKVAL